MRLFQNYYFRFQFSRCLFSLPFQALCTCNVSVNKFFWMKFNFLTNNYRTTINLSYFQATACDDEEHNWKYVWLVCSFVAYWIEVNSIIGVFLARIVYLCTDTQMVCRTVHYWLQQIASTQCGCDSNMFRMCGAIAERFTGTIFIHTVCAFFSCLSFGSIIGVAAINATAAARCCRRLLLTHKISSHTVFWWMNDGSDGLCNTFLVVSVLHAF